MGGQDSLVIGGVTPGPISDVWIETNDPDCVAFRATPEALVPPDRALTVADSVTFVFGTATVGPYTASLAPTGSCRVYDGVSSQSVNISSSGFARVEFVVGC